MSSLRLPKNAASVLERAYNGDANTSEFDKWLVHTSGVPLSNAKELSHEAMPSYNDQALREPELEWEDLSFLKPADQSWTDLGSPTLQQIFEHHLEMVERQSSDAEPDDNDDDQFYIFGFIALMRSDWRHHGVTVVHCDKDRGKWKVTQCHGMPVDQLGMELTSVSDADDDFDNIRERYDNSDNNCEDNLGGAAPEGEWQFVVYCVGISQMKAEQLIPDPRGGPDYRMGEACLWFLNWDLPAEKIQEDFPVAHASAIRDPTVPSTGGRIRICKRHPSLFAVANGEDLRSVQIAKMHWDHDVTKPDADLRAVGRESETEILSCDPASVVTRLEQLAVNGCK